MPYFSLFCLLAIVFLATAMLSFASADWPNPHVYPHLQPVHNACGKVGAWLAYHSTRLVGWGAYPLMIFIGAGAFLRITRGPIDLLWQRIGGVLVPATVTSSAVEILRPAAALNLPSGYGGALGQLFGGLLHHYFNGFGTFLLLMYCALAALLFMIDGLWSKMAHLGSGGAALIGQILSAASAAALGALESAWRLIRWPTFARSASGTGLNKSRSASRAQRSAVAKAAVATLEIEEEEEEEEDEEANIPEADSPAPLTIRRPAFRKPVVDAAECYPTTLDDWVLPPISLLEEVECSEGEQQESEAREKAKTLEQTLRDFKIEAPVVEIQTGPVITMFQLKLAPGTKVSQIAALSNDLARALRAPAVRVVATIAGKNTIGIEVPRLKRDKVRLRELMTTSGKKAQSMALPLFLGKDASGSPMVYDLAKMPHLLIAGTTGSGKSVCINSLLAGFLMTQRPDRLKLILA
ncbi:MAG: DNA translocase FtsK 4TM domain-containing protein, partial [Chloroflexi bacterium]|nr:DNA translocase FtsK 4TM domain-containing protein [Chloroflexota bacterium]